jgi:hypothetical protein
MATDDNNVKNRRQLTLAQTGAAIGDETVKQK